jgi:RimJ/RimL family protein N-acetyltransferase
MTEALTEVAEWALVRASIFCIGALCDAENIASARVMEKAGLTRRACFAAGLSTLTSATNQGTS